MTKIRRKISGVEYVNRTSDNLLKVEKESLLPLYEDLRSADCIVCGGSGRSLHSLNVAMSQIATMKDHKVVITREDVGFPGRGIYDAASKLEKRHKKIILLINSGSGETEDPKNLAEDLEQYLKETASKKFTMGLITSNPDSSIANIVRRYGNVVKVEGRGKQISSDAYSETGIMGDIFELGSLFLLQMMTEAIFEDCSVERVFELINEEAPVLGEIVDSIVDSEAYKVSIDFLERRSDVFLGGRGTAEEVSKMTAIRLFHIKKFLGDNVYIARGVNTPRPRAGDFEILISYSGETKLVVNWSNTFRDLGGTVLSLIGRKGSPLERNSDSTILIEERIKLGRPRRFYMRTAYVLSCLPVLLTERLSLKGLKLPEYILNWYHSVIE
ncbi:MAG: SIS domain-containing protein [Candidatus Bathyarchaeota archaeon]|nr:SIS domain-containing protein [Candidatus Bathyarchaeota archaeon]